MNENQISEKKVCLIGFTNRFVFNEITNRSNYEFIVFGIILSTIEWQIAHVYLGNKFFHVNDWLIEFTSLIHLALGLLAAGFMVHCLTRIKSFPRLWKILLFFVEVEVLATLLTLLAHYDFTIIIAILAEVSIFIIILTLCENPASRLPHKLTIAFIVIIVIFLAILEYLTLESSAVSVMIGSLIVIIILQQVTRNLTSIFEGNPQVNSYISGSLLLYRNLSLVALVAIGCRLVVLAIEETFQL